MRDEEEYNRWGRDNEEVTRLLRTKAHASGMLTHLDPQGHEDIRRKGLKDTPERVSNMWVLELTSGYGVNIPAIFKTFDPEEYDGIVVVKDIPFTSVCEHHLIPFVGHAHIGYLPNKERMVGLSKFARVVQAYSKRLQVQERITKQVTDAIQTHLEPRGVIVVLEAEHMCMTIRGVQAPGTKTLTSAVRGVFNTNEEGEKDEFFRLIGKA